MPWWVYEDDPTNRVRVHDAACRYCNDARGLRGSPLVRYSWHVRLGPTG